MPLKNPIIFTILVLAVLFGAAAATYFYGLPLLQTGRPSCLFGGSIKSFGCSSSFGTFMTWVVVAVALAVGAIWTKFGQQ